MLHRRRVVQLTQTPLLLKPASSPLKTGVYMIRNRVNGKVYVGSAAVSLKNRIRHHINALRRGDHCNSKLQNSWNKYGEQNFEFSVLAKCLPVWCIVIEQIHIQAKRASSPDFGYNLCPNAGSALGVLHSESTKKRFREIAKSRVLSEESRKKISVTMRAMFADPEYRKMAVANMRAGITPDGIKRGAEKKRGKIVPTERRLRISEKLKGRIISIETRLKISEKAIGRRKKNVAP